VFETISLVIIIMIYSFSLDNIIYKYFRASRNESNFSSSRSTRRTSTRSWYVTCVSLRTILYYFTECIF